MWRGPAQILLPLFRFTAIPDTCTMTNAGPAEHAQSFLCHASLMPALWLRQGWQSMRSSLCARVMLP